MRIRTAPVLLCLLAATGCSNSSGTYTTRTPASAPVSAPRLATPSASVRITLSAEQAAAVRAWAQPQASPSRGRGNGNGNGNRGLPPGIARNLERGKALPPGIAKQYLPQDLIVRLPRLQGGLDYVVAAGKLLLVEATTQVVREVLIDGLYS
jgi:hypothetical protein